MFYLRMDSPMDAFILADVLHAIYSTFWADYTVPYLSDSAAASGPAPDLETGRAQAVRSMNRPGPQPDNSEVFLPAKSAGCVCCWRPFRMKPHSR
jgi:hypothetical protein